MYNAKRCTRRFYCCYWLVHQEIMKITLLFFAGLFAEAHRIYKFS
jgi:hypothetical protein